MVEKLNLMTKEKVKTIVMVKKSLSNEELVLEMSFVCLLGADS